MPHVITDQCEKDQACAVVCPVDCIYDGPERFYIEPDECIDCGLCIPECPVSAIMVLSDHSPPNGHGTTT